MDFNHLFEQAQRMSRDLEENKSKIENQSFKLECQGDLITGSMNGKYEITDLHISDTLMEDKDMLEAMLTITLNKASKKITEAKEDTLKSATGGIDVSSFF